MHRARDPRTGTPHNAHPLGGVCVCVRSVHGCTAHCAVCAFCAACSAAKDGGMTFVYPIFAGYPLAAIQMMSLRQPM
jgi:hypothetical protein